MKYLSLAIILYCANCFADLEMLTHQDLETQRRLEDLKFRSSLSTDEVMFATNSLVMPRDTIVEAALCVIAVHNVPVTFPSGMGSEYGQGRIMAEIIKKGRERKQPTISFLKKDSFRTDITHIVKQGVSYELDDSSYRDINEKLGHIAAVFIAREMRQGKSIRFNGDDYSFSDYDKLLIEYAKYPASEIPKMIIPIFAEATHLTTQDYNLLRILISYEDINLDLVLSALQKKDIGKYAKKILLEVLDSKVNALGSADQEKIRMALKNYDYDTDWFRRLHQLMK